MKDLNFLEGPVKSCQPIIVGIAGADTGKLGEVLPSGSRVEGIDEVWVGNVSAWREPIKLLENIVEVPPLDLAEAGANAGFDHLASDVNL
jgi:hypothetical protein